MTAELDEQGRLLSDFAERISSLEQFKNDMQAEMVARLTEQVANRIHMALPQYLPKVAILITDVSHIEKHMDR